MASIKIPFQFQSGKVLTTSIPSRVAEQKIVDVLTTNNYERVMRHSYGAGIDRLLFEPIDALNIADFSVDAKQEMSDNITRVTILDLRISEEEEMVSFGNPETTLGVTVVYQIPLGAPQVLSFKIESTGVLVEDTPI